MDETARMLALLNGAFPDITQLPPAEARALVDARIRPQVEVDGVSSEDLDIDADAGPIRVRVYRADAPVTGLPVTVYAHGGGFVHGRIEGHDAFCRSWVAATGGVVVSVEYRLAPEHPAPAAFDDVTAVAMWIDAHRERVAADSRGLVLAGDSAGATIAAVVARRLRDDAVVDVRAQVLLYPMIDPARGTDSHVRNAEGAFITSAMIGWYWDAYLHGAADAVRESADIHPLRADLAGLAPAVVVVGGRDPLCDEGCDYARALADAGVPVILRRYPDQFHGFVTIPGYGPGRSASALLFADLDRLLTEETS